MTNNKLTASEYADFLRGVDHDDDAAWERFKVALSRITGTPQDGSIPEGWTATSEPGW